MASHLPSVPLASLGEMLSPNTLCRNNKKFGRKKIIEKKVNRNRPITYSFRVSERERKIIDEKVKSSGLNRTEFLIRALTNKPVTVIGQGDELLTELKRQGNNLNQALRNSYLKPGEKQVILSAVAECKRAYRELLSAIEGD